MDRNSSALAVMLVIITLILVGAGVWYTARVTAPVAQGTGEPKSLPIDNSKLVMSLGFGQKPDGHVDVIKMNAQGYVLCAPVTGSAPAPAPVPAKP